MFLTHLGLIFCARGFRYGSNFILLQVNIQLLSTTFSVPLLFSSICFGNHCYILNGWSYIYLFEFFILLQWSTGLFCVLVPYCFYYNNYPCNISWNLDCQFLQHRSFWLELFWLFGVFVVTYEFWHSFFSISKMSWRFWLGLHWICKQLLVEWPFSQC